MKKVLFFAAILVACSTLSSCQKTCSCKEKKSGYTQTIQTDSQYRTCKDIQDLFKTTAKGLNQSWTCTEK